jgi:PX domain
MTPVIMPKFPPKKIKNMNSEVIEERKESLSRYMNELAQVLNIFGDQDVRNFIAMKDTEFM